MDRIDIELALRRAKHCRNVLNTLNNTIYIKESNELFDKTVKAISIYERMLALMDANKYLVSTDVTRLLQEAEEELKSL